MGNSQGLLLSSLSASKKGFISQEAAASGLVLSLASCIYVG